MKKRKVLWLWCLTVILCFPLVGFKASSEETSSKGTVQTETGSILNSSDIAEQTTESTEYSTETVASSSDSVDETLISEKKQVIKKDEPSVQTEPISEKFFISISDVNYVLLKNLDGEIIDDGGKNYQKTLAAQEVTSDDDTKYYILSNPKGEVGYIDPNSTERVTGEEGKLFSESDAYASIQSTDAKLFTIDFEQNGTTEELKDQTFKIAGYYNHYDEKVYYLLKNSSDQSIGIVEASAVEKTNNPAGIKHAVNDYYSVINKDQKIWKDLNFAEDLGTTALINEKTFNIKEWYYHFNGKKYFALYDDSQAFKGFVEAITIERANNAGGIWRTVNQYITVTKNHGTIWNDFEFKSGKTTKSMYQRTYRATGYYNHFNGTKYLSVYDNKGNWQGYLNERDASVSSTPGGRWNSTNQYVTITKISGTIWNDFEFKSGKTSKSMYQRTYRATGYYNHFNGTKYLSVYDNKGNWQGYLNERDASVSSTPGGRWNSTNQYVTITKISGTIWNDFEFKSGKTTKSMYQRTYRATGYYNHFNGTKYLSVYDNKGNWQGYLNQRDGSNSNGAQGTGFSMNKSVLVIKSGYSIWNNFSWKEKTRTNSLINKTYQVKWYYKHMNGATYYSLYDSNGKWFGYVNSGAVRERRGAAQYMGTTRQRVLNELTVHQNDRFYLSTPYRGLSSSNPEPFLSPYGAPNGHGPGMNCTGFVACVMRRSGGNLNRISGITQGWGSYANAYNWRDALMRNTEYYTFNSVDTLLKSGKAQKGDIIYFDPVWTDINYDCHIGIFWGNRSNENRIWHQVLAGNMQSHIFSGTRFSKIYLFPQD
ncbi:hypothetical protein [Enterococcus avium]|uniref:hypothetical protein n=2 Tax=Enterococcus avium TaxID=33945 RepID=UPI0022E5608A|nr:hypothetical protein [Enterococcus avium]